MKTLGERMRQAREGKGLSAEKLALLAGYKTQSGIANLENRAGGSGGKRLFVVAKILDVSTDWLLNGPDCDSPPYLTKEPPRINPITYQASITHIGTMEREAPNITPPIGIDAALERIANACKALAPETRSLAASLLSELAQKPDNCQSVAAAFNAVLSLPNRHAA